jgi:histidinol phosphatase-like PHP family hydrolase
MKVELHLHSNRYGACAVDPPETLMRTLIASGYDAVYITEHDAVWSEAEIAELQDAFPEILIFPGIELSLGMRASMHLVVLGTTDPDYANFRYDQATALEKAQSHGNLTILAHPFRWYGGSAMLDKWHCPDAIEFRTSNHDAVMAERSLAEAKRLGIRLVNCGDVHAREMINRYWIETHVPLVEPNDIHDIIVNGLYDLCIREPKNRRDNR